MCDSQEIFLNKFYLGIWQNSLRDNLLIYFFGNTSENS